MEVERPRPAAGEVVLRVRAALTCGTDLKTFLRGHPKFPTPTLFGHEYAGEVAEVGAGVKGVRPGDAVMAVPTGPCGQCYYCRHGDENLCETIMEEYALGGFGEFVRLPARVVRTNLFPKPAQLGFAEAALLEPLACVVHGLEMVPVRPDSSVIIIGAGAISLLHLLALRAMGARDIAVIGRGEARVARALGLGARSALAGGIAAARDAVVESTEGRGADIVIECTGQTDVWATAPSLARRGGWVVLFGGCPAGSRVSYETGRLHYDQIRLVSPFHFTPRAVRRAKEMLETGMVDGRPLITREFPLESLGEALHRHHLGEGVKYAVIP